MHDTSQSGIRDSGGNANALRGTETLTGKPEHVINSTVAETPMPYGALKQQWKRILFGDLRVAETPMPYGALKRNLFREYDAALKVAETPMPYGALKLQSPVAVR